MMIAIALSLTLMIAATGVFVASVLLPPTPRTDAGMWIGLIGMIGSATVVGATVALVLP